LSEVSIDPPIPSAIGVSQGAMRHWRSESQVVELVAARAQTNFYIFKTLAIGDLSKGHGEKLIPAREATNLVVAVVTSDTPPKLFGVDPFHQLSENSFSRIHGRSLASKISENLDNFPTQC
jgi:hypothetical protein